MSKKTFKDRYNDEKNKNTPAQDFVENIARMTHRSKTTVKMWLTGVQRPDDLVKTILANHFNCKPDELFPEVKTK
jgi:hypothetical protein